MARVAFPFHYPLGDHLRGFFTSTLGFGLLWSHKAGLDKQWLERYTTAKDVAGSYSVDVNGLSASFTVKEKPSHPPVKLFNRPLVGGLIAGMVAVRLLIFLLVRRRA